MVFHRDLVHKRFKELETMISTSASTVGVDVSRLFRKLAFLAAITLPVGGWVWFLGVGIKWLIVKL